MPTTTHLELRYPVSGDAPDVPLWLQRLAEDVDDNFTDTGWLDVTVLSGFAGINATEKPQVRRIGKLCKMRGGFSNTGMSINTTHTAGELPAGFPPPPVVNTQAALNSSVAPALAAGFVTALGEIQVRTSGTLGSYYKIDPLSWWVD